MQTMLDIRMHFCETRKLQWKRSESDPEGTLSGVNWGSSQIAAIGDNFGVRNQSESI